MTATARLQLSPPGYRRAVLLTRREGSLQRRAIRQKWHIAFPCLSRQQAREYVDAFREWRTA